MMTRRVLIALAVWFIPTLSLAQAYYNYFGPVNGVLFGTTASGFTRAATATDLASLAGCAATQLVFTNATPALTCSANLTWSDSTGTLTVGNGGTVIVTNPAGATNQKTFEMSPNIDGVGDVGFGIVSDVGVLGDTLVFNRNNSNQLTSFAFTMSGAASGLMTFACGFSTDCQLTASNNPHIQINDPNLTHNTAIDLKINAVIQESWACFGSSYTGNSPLAGAPSGAQCFVGDGNASVPQPLFIGTARNAMLLLDSFTNGFAAKIPQPGVYHTAGITWLTATNATGAAAIVGIGDAVNAGSKLTIGGHYAYNTGLPVVSACGTSPSIDAHATDSSGTVTVGTVSASSCTITFANAYSTWNHCRVTSQGVVASLAYSYTLSAITVTATSLVGDLLDYGCDGN